MNLHLHLQSSIWCYYRKQPPHTQTPVVLNWNIYLQFLIIWNFGSIPQFYQALSLNCDFQKPFVFVTQERSDDQNSFRITSSTQVVQLLKYSGRRLDNCNWREIEKLEEWGMYPISTSANYYQSYSYETSTTKSHPCTVSITFYRERDVFHTLNSFCRIVTLYEWVIVQEKCVSVLTLYYPKLLS